MPEFSTSDQNAFCSGFEVPVWEPVLIDRLPLSQRVPQPELGNQIALGDQGPNRNFSTPQKPPLTRFGKLHILAPS